MPDGCPGRRLTVPLCVALLAPYVTLDVKWYFTLIKAAVEQWLSRSSGNTVIVFKPHPRPSLKWLLPYHQEIKDVLALLTLSTSECGLVSINI